VLVALAGFLFTSFCEPGNVRKSRKIMTEMVYARSYEEFEVEIKKQFDEYKNEKMLTLPELIRWRADFENEKTNRSQDIFNSHDNSSLIRKVDWEIAGKYALPFIIILFYFTGVFMGMSFYRIHFIAPVLITFFLIFYGWYYCRRLFEYWYKKNDINVFWGAFGPGILICVLLVCWYFGLRKYGAFKKQEEEGHLDLTPVD
jgi:lipopolysaccharide export LptBFGC system permease protein LptF